MSDKDFEVLQTALSPEVSESQEQVRYSCREHCVVSLYGHLLDFRLQHSYTSVV